MRTRPAFPGTCWRRPLHVELDVHLLHVLTDGHGVAEGAAAQLARVRLALRERQVALEVQLVAVTLAEALSANLASATGRFLYYRSTMRRVHQPCKQGAQESVDLRFVANRCACVREANCCTTFDARKESLRTRMRTHST